MRASAGERERRRAETPQIAPVVAVWGGPGSGKSGIAGALHAESGRTAGHRWTILCESLDLEGREFVESASLALRRRGVRETTIHRPVASTVLPLCRRDDGRALERLDLLVVDPGGATGRSPADEESCCRRAACADGLLWLIDVPVGGRLPVESRTALLHEIVAFLAAADAAQLPMPVALCLTKLDRLPAAEMHQALARPEDALRAVLGDPVFGWMEAACPRLGCFALTAAGSVRNAVRPAGLTPALDWFSTERRRAARMVQSAARRSRHSARVARVRQALPTLAHGIAAAAIVSAVALGAAWLAGRVQVSRTWVSSSGVLAVDDAPAAAARVQLAGAPQSSADVTLLSATSAYRRGDMRDALQMLAQLQLPPDEPERAEADSLIALAALRGTAEALDGERGADVLPLVVATTSGAIDRGTPGSFALAPLYLARAGACIGGELGCADRQVREDLAWVLLLGSAEQQDEARRLRSAWDGDSSAPPPTF